MRVLLFVALYTYALFTQAIPIERTLSVSVDILVDQNSSELQIVAPVDSFVAIYNQREQKFNDLNMLFYVKTTSGLSLSYTLSLTDLKGVCDATTTLEMAAMLDDAAIAVGEVTAPTSGVNDLHSLRLIFDGPEQMGMTQYCNGHASIIASLEI